MQKLHSSIIHKKAIGDVVITDDCKNTHAINELEVPMIVMGAKNMIIVAGYRLASIFFQDNI